MRTALTFLGSILIAGTAAAQNPQTPVPSVPNSMPKPNVATAPKETAPKDAAAPSAAPTTSGTHSSTAPAQTGNSGRTADQNEQKSAPGQNSKSNEAAPMTQPSQQQPSPQSATQQSQQHLNGVQLNGAQQNGAQLNPALPQQSGSLQNPNSNRSTFSQSNQSDLNSRSTPSNSAPSSAAPSNSAQYSNRNSTDRSSAADRSGGREHTAMRASDLRAPDLGLWFDRSARDGLVISDIATSGAISRLGFREGDRIVSVNGRRVAREADFISYLLGNDLAAGAAQPVAVVVSRDGQDQTIEVDPSLLLADYGDVAPTAPLDQFGLVLDDRYNDQIVVWKVLPRSPAYYAGIRAGDVLTGFHDHPLTNTREFEKTIADTNPGDVSVQVRRNGRTRDLQADVPRFDQGSEHRTAMRPNYDTGNADQSNQADQSSQSNTTQRSDQQQNRSDRDSNRRGIFRANR